MCGLEWHLLVIENKLIGFVVKSRAYVWKILTKDALSAGC
jgi:hypothetical protein